MTSKSVVRGLAMALAGAGVWCGQAATYYVDSAAGDDGREGTSEATAWKSLDKVNAAALVPGDVVRFKRGGLWRGSLRPHSGVMGQPITYTTYGKGQKPILEQSIARSDESDWFEVQPGLWSTRLVKPAIYEQVWSPLPDDDSYISFQGGTKGSFEKVVKDGSVVYRIRCTAKGKRIAPNYIQLWGPAFHRLPDVAVVRFKMRSTKPFDFDKLHLLQGNAPYTQSHVARFKCVHALGTEWTDVEAVLERTKAVMTGVPRFNLYFGDSLPVGATVEVKLDGVWRASVDRTLAIPYDVGIFIVNHGEKWGVKKWLRPGWDVPKSQTWQRSVQMTNDLDFAYDPENSRVLVKYPQNPGKAFDSIELAMTRHVVNEGGCHDVSYDGLWVRYGAAHGFGGGSVSNLVIRNCDISWIGGGLQFWRTSEKTGKVLYPVRFGNGIEFWGNAKNCLIERCRLWEVYDAAVTNQGRDDKETEITWRDNVIWNSEYSYEYWNRGLTRNVLFEHNTCVDAGKGWAHAQRPDPNGAHLMYYHNRAATTNFVVRNNIFCRATEWTMRSGLDWRKGLTQNHNLVYNEGKVPVCRWLDGKSLVLCTWAEYQALGLDVQGQFAEPVFVDPSKRDYRLAPNSPGQTLGTDGTPVGARNMPGLDVDQSVR